MSLPLSADHTTTAMPPDDTPPLKKRKLTAHERLLRDLKIDVVQEAYVATTLQRSRKSVQPFAHDNNTAPPTDILQSNDATPLADDTAGKIAEVTPARRTGCRQCKFAKRVCDGTKLDCALHKSKHTTLPPTTPITVTTPQLPSKSQHVTLQSALEHLRCKRNDFDNPTLMQKYKDEYNSALQLNPFLKYNRVSLDNLTPPNWFDLSVQHALMHALPPALPKAKPVKAEDEPAVQYTSQSIRQWSDIPVITPALPVKFKALTPFKPLQSNKYLKRTNADVSDDDEADKCNCKAPKRDDYDDENDMVGCTDECMLRGLQIECCDDANDPRRRCPTGQYCSNRQFQKQQYRQLRVAHTGIADKGYGLYADEDIRTDEFIIEYVGEVIDDDSVLDKRTKRYAETDTHVYLMTLSEYLIIDATIHGNVSRYLNHSCQPNCRMQRWTVNGKHCMGLFAIRPISEGDELTFDYRFERFGDTDKQTCHCGSQMCRGHLGGKTLQENIVALKQEAQDDDDEHMSEQVTHTEISMLEKAAAQLFCTAVSYNTHLTAKWSGMHVSASDQAVIDSNHRGHPLYLKRNVATVHDKLLRQHTDVLRAVATDNDDADVFFTGILNNFEHKHTYYEYQSLIVDSKTALANMLTDTQAAYMQHRPSSKSSQTVDIQQAVQRRSVQVKKTAVRYRRHTDTKTSQATAQAPNQTYIDAECHNCHQSKSHHYTCMFCYTDHELAPIGDCGKLYCVDCVHDVYHERPYFTPLSNITSSAWCCPSCRHVCKCETCAITSVLSPNNGGARRSRTAARAAEDKMKVNAKMIRASNGIFDISSSMSTTPPRIPKLAKPAHMVKVEVQCYVLSNGDVVADVQIWMRFNNRKNSKRKWKQLKCATSVDPQMYAADETTADLTTASNLAHGDTQTNDNCVYDSDATPSLNHEQPADSPPLPAIALSGDQHNQTKSDQQHGTKLKIETGNRLVAVVRDECMVNSSLITPLTTTLDSHMSGTGTAFDMHCCTSGYTNAFMHTSPTKIASQAFDHAQAYYHAALNTIDNFGYTTGTPERIKQQHGYAHASHPVPLNTYQTVHTMQ